MDIHHTLYPAPDRPRPASRSAPTPTAEAVAYLNAALAVMDPSNPGAIAAIRRARGILEGETAPTVSLRYMGVAMRGVLLTLGNGPRTIREIIEHTRCHTASIYSAVRRLQERGLVEPCGDALTLSDAGVSLRARVRS